MPTKRPTEMFFNSLLSLAVFLFLIVLLEVGLRICHCQSDNFLKQDPVLGWIHLENKTGRSITKEYNVVKRIGHYGIMKEDYSLEKPADVFRIAVIGDSVTEAMQVNDRASFTSLLEQDLNINKRSSKKIEVLNFGVTSYGTIKELYVLENLVLRFKPDLVILGFFSGNDFSDNLSESVETGASFDKKEEFINSVKLFLRNHLSVVRFYLEKKSHNKMFTHFAEKETSITLPAFHDLSASTVGKTENYLRRFQELAGNNHLPLIILVLPSKEQVHQQFQSALTEDLNSVAFSKQLTDFFKKSSINYIDLLPNFVSWATLNKGKLLYFPIDGHLNESGHQLVSESIFNYLTQARNSRKYGF